MKDDTFSVIVGCWSANPADAMQVRVVRVDTGEEIRFKDGNFLLRVTLEAETSIMRCQLRHLTIDREAHLQSGPGMLEFINSCLRGTNGLQGKDSSSDQDT